MAREIYLLYNGGGGNIPPESNHMIYQKMKFCLTGIIQNKTTKEANML